MWLLKTTILDSGAPKPLRQVIINVATRLSSRWAIPPICIVLQKCLHLPLKYLEVGNRKYSKIEVMVADPAYS